MTKKELIENLKNCKEFSLWDEEIRHIYADMQLLEFINDCEITKAFDPIEKWYA